MKKIILILVFAITLMPIWGQEKISFYFLDGTPIPETSNASINEVFQKHFSKYKISKTSFDEIENFDGFIISQAFSYKPLFLCGTIPKNKKELTKIIEIFNENHQYLDKNIDDNFSLKSQIEEAIELKLTDLFFLRTLGKPNKSYQNSNEMKVYTYNGIEKVFDLIFQKGVLTDYRIYGGI